MRSMRPRPGPRRRRGGGRRRDRLDVAAHEPLAALRGLGDERGALEHGSTCFWTAARPCHAAGPVRRRTPARAGRAGRCPDGSGRPGRQTRSTWSISIPQPCGCTLRRHRYVRKGADPAPRPATNASSPVVLERVGTTCGCAPGARGALEALTGRRAATLACRSRCRSNTLTSSCYGVGGAVRGNRRALGPDASQAPRVPSCIVRDLARAASPPHWRRPVRAPAAGGLQRSATGRCST